MPSAGPPPPAHPALSAGQPALKARGLTKSFGGVKALRDASIDLERGVITALIGDNGAGKSTLVRCLCGVYQPDAGTVELGGRTARFETPLAAREAGIETVHQNLALVEDLAVWQNFFLGREKTKGFGPFRMLDRRAMRRAAQEMVSVLAVNAPSVTSRVRRLSGGQRQAVAIARAAGWGGSIVIMDEPTAALGVQETARVEGIIRRLRDQGVAVLLISHNFDQVLRLADRVCVMRSGRTVAERQADQTTGDELVALITGALEGSSKPAGAAAPPSGSPEGRKARSRSSDSGHQVS
ncbi:MAG: ATP-binding cassette domain-containing protein [Bifidobacteriaceae bacterium]|jgi:ABC-type sugar transport system ATPase subunit|nr:ATP-binding cassette domain-containing protein [Bifidobacteriaceae bacterium]